MTVVPLQAGEPHARYTQYGETFERLTFMPRRASTGLDRDAAHSNMTSGHRP